MYNLLVVDDERTYREGVVRVIGSLGDYTVFNASDGLEAFDIIKKNDIDGMVLDISMPSMNGIELLEELDDLGLNDTATVVLSGHDEFEFAQKAMQHRAMDFTRDLWDQAISSESAALNIIMRRKTYFNSYLSVIIIVFVLSQEFQT